MTNPQGTVWETDLVNRAKLQGRSAQRYPKMASKGEPDLFIEGRPGYDLPTIPLLAWKRLTGKKAEGRRTPDGVRAVIVIDAEDFYRDVLPWLPHRFEVQAKWTSALNVTRVLGDLKAWLKGRA